MNIHNEIKTAITTCAMKTGKNAKSIYLGRKQMERLMQCAHENQYIGYPKKEPKEGLHRPEVEGCLVYEVNDDSHCVAV